MRETFLRAIPETIRERARTWSVDRDPNDEVGAIWERIARGTLIGVGFGRDLFELRDDPAAVWVAAFGVVSGDDRVTMMLTTRAMFTRFGEDLVGPVATLAAHLTPGRRAWVGKALRTASVQSGTPPTQGAHVMALADQLDPEVGAGSVAVIGALRQGTISAAFSGLLGLWRGSRDAALLPILRAVGAYEAEDPFVTLRPMVLAGDWAAADAFFDHVAGLPDPRLAVWLDPWTELQAASGRGVPVHARSLLVGSLPATRALVDRLGIEAADPPVFPIDPKQIAALSRACRVRPDARIEPLWSEVYAHPEDLTARWVLADVYTERGNPRGPFMAQSLSPAGIDSPPDAAALRRYEREWLGGFFRHTLGPRIWRAGVLVGCKARGLSAASLERPEWRLVEQVLLESSLEEVTPARFPSLRVLGMVVMARLGWLEESGLLEQLDTAFIWTNSAFPTADDLQALAAFPSPEKLVLVGAWTDLRDPRPETRALLTRFRRAERTIPRGTLWPAILPPVQP